MEVEAEAVMTRLRPCRAVLLTIFLTVLLTLASGTAFGQNPGGWYVFRPNQEVRVPELHPLTARSQDLSDVLLTSLDIVFNDPGVCCGRDSALEDRATAANPLSLQEIASKVQGRQLLSDGRPIQITADFLPTGTTVDASYWIISHLRAKHAMLLVWGSHLYVLYGAVFDEDAYSDGSSVNMIHKLLLLDTRYSDSRRTVTFDRDRDDWTKVQGLLLLSAVPQ